jgi:hypothetical protein
MTARILLILEKSAVIDRAYRSVLQIPRAAKAAAVIHTLH